jgi:hypothetical protein
LTNFSTITEFPIGWVRDLTIEGIEPNPGPTWDELLATISAKFTAGMPTTVGDRLSEIYAKICEAHKVDPEFLFPDTNHVLEYLKNNSDVNPQIVNLINEAMQKIGTVTFVLSDS